MKTKLIALAVLAAAVYTFLPSDVAEGAEFEVESTDAEALLTAGKAKLAEPPLAPAAKVKTVKARVLTACAHGEANDLAEVPADLAKQAEKDGLIDTEKAAVAYAASLAQNQKAAG